MFAEIGTKTGAYTGQNVHKGEMDCAYYLTILLGMPVFFLYQRCVHEVDLSLMKPGPRRERLRRFFQEYLGHTCLNYLGQPVSETEVCHETVTFDLRHRKSLKRMTWAFFTLLILALISVFGLLFTLVFLFQADGIPEDALPALIGTWVALGVLILGMIRYHRAQKTTPRQAKIRAAVAEQLGPFSDPAEWQFSLAETVVRKKGLEPDAEKVLNCADQEFRLGHVSDAIILARLSLGIAKSPDPAFVQRAESITDDYLKRLSDS